MSNENAFTRILSRLDDSDPGTTEKTAAVTATESVEARMLEQVRAVADATSKTASAAAPAPTASLESMAKSAQEAEQTQLVKQAHFMGAALADGFMERFAAYDSALSAQGVKMASVPAEGTVKEAAQAGYQQAVADMEKHANAQYEEGYKDQLAAIHKTASEIHYAGQMVAHNLVEQAQRANAK